MILRHWFDWLRPHALFLAPIIFILGVGIFVRLTFVPLTLSTDAYSYMSSAELISGHSVDKLYPGRLLKPLAPLGIALSSLLFNGNLVYGFLFLNSMCYLLLSVSCYFLLLLFTEDRSSAQLVTLIFVTAYPVLKYGLDLYSEMGAWFFFILAIIGIINYHRNHSWRNFWIAMVPILLGLLWKEYAVLAGIFLGLVILFEGGSSWRLKAGRITLLGLFSVLVLVLAQIVVYALYHYTYLDWLRDAAEVNSALSEYTPFYIGKSLVGVYLLGWALALFGVCNWGKIPNDNRKIILLLLPPSLMFLLWTFVSSRLYYVVAPLLTIVALYGLESIPRKYHLRELAVFIVVLGNFSWLCRDVLVTFLG